MISFIQRLIDWIRGKKRRRELVGPGLDAARAARNEAIAVDRIRKSTHPQYGGHFGRLEQHTTPGTSRTGGWWVIQGGIGGYYDQTRERAYTVANPADPNDYVDEVMIHEAGHHKEHLMGLIPPWHYPPWVKLFVNWRNYPMAVADLESAQLPGVEPGDVVEIDYIGIGGLLAKATQDGLEIMV